MSNRTEHPVIEPDELNAMHGILDDLRESGSINMFGAPRWLQDNCELTREEAMHVFKTWSDKYDS